MTGWHCCAPISTACGQRPDMSTPDEAPFAMLLASSIHDIKNSLGMLMERLAAVIETIPADSQQQRQFATVQGEAARINNDLMYLLGLYRLQQQSLPLRIEEVWLDEFLQEQVAQQSLLFSLRNTTCQISCDPWLSGYFDRNLIAGVLNNVLVNGARYARQSLHLSAFAQDGGIIVQVADDGPGFPEPLLTLGQAHAGSIDFTTGSSSLGLHFAREVAALHRRGELQGRIELANPASGGGLFTLFLP